MHFRRKERVHCGFALTWINSSATRTKNSNSPISVTSVISSGSSETIVESYPFYITMPEFSNIEQWKKERLRVVRVVVQCYSFVTLRYVTDVARDQLDPNSATPPSQGKSDFSQHSEENPWLQNAQIWLQNPFE